MSAVRKVQFLPEAEAELLHEIAYYSKARTGYGLRFSSAVKIAAARAANSPESGAPGPQGTRKFRVVGFPFNLIFRHTALEVLVIALAHDRKKPGYWRERAAHPD